MLVKYLYIPKTVGYVYKCPRFQILLFFREAFLSIGCAFYNRLQ